MGGLWTSIVNQFQVVVSVSRCVWCVCWYSRDFSSSPTSFLPDLTTSAENIQQHTLTDYKTKQSQPLSTLCLSGCRSSALLPGRSWTPGETPRWKWTFEQRKVPVCKNQHHVCALWLLITHSITQPSFHLGPHQSALHGRSGLVHRETCTLVNTRLQLLPSLSAFRSNWASMVHSGKQTVLMLLNKNQAQAGLHTCRKESKLNSWAIVRLSEAPFKQTNCSFSSSVHDLIVCLTLRSVQGRGAQRGVHGDLRSSGAPRWRQEPLQGQRSGRPCSHAWLTQNDSEISKHRNKQTFNCSTTVSLSPAPPCTLLLWVSFTISCLLQVFWRPSGTSTTLWLQPS